MKRQRTLRPQKRGEVKDSCVSGVGVLAWTVMASWPMIFILNLADGFITFVHLGPWM